MEGLLSQAEIDALLGGGDSGSSEETNEEPTTAAAKTILTKEEEDAIGEIGNISLGSSSTALSTLLMKDVSITTPRVEVLTFNELKGNLSQEDKALIQIEYKTGFSGLNVLLIDKKDAIIIGDLMMGNSGENPPEELDELYLSAVGEAMNQMMGSAATALAGMFSKEVDIMPPVVSISNIDELKGKSPFFSSHDEFIAVIFDMEIEGLIKTNIYQIISIKFAKETTRDMYALGEMGGVEEIAVEEVPQQQTEQQQYQQQPMQQQQQMYQQPMQQQQQQYQQQMYQQPMQQQQQMYQQPMQQQQPTYQQNVNVQNAQFQSFGAPAMEALPANIDMIMDVPLNVTVELGRTRMQIKEILDLGPGSIVELDKLAGEPVDILVNSKLIAKGEVVVIDESFGVRITDIVSQMERLNKVQ